MTVGTIYIRTQGKNFGPYNEDELRQHIKAGRISFSEWIYLGEGWQLLGELKDFREQHPEFEAAPKSAPTKEKAQAELAPPARARRAESASGATALSGEPVWFFIREKKKFGPYSTAELVGQLQRKQLNSASYVWKPGFETWQKMSQVSEFSRDAMKRLASDGVPLDILVKRKFARAPYEVEVVAHDNTRAVEGKTMMIGEGGLFLSTTKPSHVVGARLKLHFREGDTPSFNAIAEVVSVVRGEASGYCLRFVALSDSDRRRIAKFVRDVSKPS